ncbi:heme A synthase [Streptomyces sp. HPF1205]|uniref:COX15/CtaA family protein n=1 Tax=Streptomyces sp. HPF1205 TaxID=2873262 RepID=UPI001CECC83F|nr:COX15/CtaA family protein [Streptomyces sp. HPF1205]
MSKLPEIARNPFAFLAARWTPDAVTVRRAALSSVVMSVVLIVTGGAVRLTGSGLGCPTWPTCQGDSIIGTNAWGAHHAIELGNRMLTYVLCAAVGWTILAVRAHRPLRRGVYRLAWAQFWVVVANAVWGGVTVLTHLNPYVVAVHFLLSAAQITVAVLTWHRAGESDAAPRPLVGKPVRQLGQALTAASGALLAVGTLVTGAGPHPGDSRDVHRIGLDWRTVAQLHADLAWIVIALTGALWFVLRAVDAPAGPRARTRDLFLVLMSQGVIGYVQYATKLPVGLVELHMLGAALIWVAVLRLVLSFRDRSADPREPAGGTEGHEQLDGRAVSTAVSTAVSAQGRGESRGGPRERPQRAGGPDTTAAAPSSR